MFVNEQALRPQLRRLSLALIAAIAASRSLAGGTAAASCGDYVSVGGSRQHDSEHSMPSNPSCKGPNCQQKLPPPALPTKALLTFQHSDSAYCAQHDGSSDRPFVHAVVERGLTLPKGHLLNLLRPPCL
jgi:hypothetical protein